MRNYGEVRTAERRRQKAHCEDVRRRIPPILINGLLDACPGSHEDNDFCGCLEDAVALEVEQKPL